MVLNIELRNVTHNQRLSQETPCFAADIWIDGKKVATVQNNGTGGANSISPYSVEQQLNDYGKTLPKFEAFGKMFDVGADNIIANLLDPEHWIQVAHEELVAALNPLRMAPASVGVAS